jgi:small subunit ribosomal protein S19
MAKKEFSYRGKSLHDLEKMSVTELADLFPSDIRRKIKRGFTEQEQDFLKKLMKKGKVKTHCRDMIILPSMVGKTVGIHNGKTFDEVFLTEEMIGHYLGEFTLTRKVVKHGSAGVGATKSGAAAETRK